jgi:outer membrane protein assembly factor BamB
MRRFHVFGVVVLAVAALLLMTSSAPAAAAGGASAGDWPQWRGPDRENVAADTGLLKEWPADGPPLAWQVEGVGNGFSSVIVVGGTLYTQGTVKGDESVIAINLADQKTLWTTPIGKGDHSQSTPTFSDGMIYAEGFNGEVVCLQAADGKDVWHKTLKELGAGGVPGWRYAESPFVDGDRVMVTPGGDKAVIVALNKKTGETIWKTELPEKMRCGGAQYSTIAVSNAGGVKQYVTLIMGLGLVSVAAEDGKFLWNYRKINNGTANIPTAVAIGDNIFCSTGYQTGAALLKASGTAAEEVYFLDKNTFQNHHGGFLRIGDYIYGGHGHSAGNPTCIELKTGKVMWTQQQAGGGSGSCVAADGHLYFLWEKGEVALIEASPDGYKLTGKFKLPRQDKEAWAHPVVCGGKLYLRWGDKLFCYDVKAQ